MSLELQYGSQGGRRVAAADSAATDFPNNSNPDQEYPKNEGTPTPRGSVDKEARELQVFLDKEYHPRIKDIIRKLMKLHEDGERTRRNCLAARSFATCLTAAGWDLNIESRRVHGTVSIRSAISDVGVGMTIVGSVTNIATDVYEGMATENDSREKEELWKTYQAYEARRIHRFTEMMNNVPSADRELLPTLFALQGEVVLAQDGRSPDWVTMLDILNKRTEMTTQSGKEVGKYIKVLYIRNLTTRIRESTEGLQNWKGIMMLGFLLIGAVLYMYI